MTVIDGQAITVPSGPSDPVAVPDDPKPYIRLGLLILIASFGIFGGWSAVAPLESAVVAVGQVKVEARRKVIQHLEGGIVADILVDQGDHVEAQELLIQLSDVKPSAQLRIVRLQWLAALVLEARLIAERKGQDEIAFPPEVMAAARTDAEVQEMIATETEVFNARAESLENERLILGRRIDQLREQILGVEGLLKAQEARIESYRGEVDEWQRLYEAKLADKVRLLQLRRELAELEGENASTVAKLAELKVAVGEAQAKLVLREQQQISEVIGLLRETQSKIADLAARILALEDTLSRTGIRTPVDGIVVGLRVRTIGAVVGPGEPLMEIVPKSDELVVVASVSPTDIDSVRVGQTADLRFSAFDLRNTLVVTGSVVNLSADAMQDQSSGMSFYEAEVKVKPEGIQRLQADGFELVPGMPAEVLIKIGGRSLLNYLTKPFLDMFARAFREQ